MLGRRAIRLVKSCVQVEPRPPPKCPKSTICVFTADAYRSTACSSRQEYVGTSRNNNRAQITEFLRIFGLPFEDADRKPVPFCAAGVVYAAIEAYCMIDPSIKVIAEESPTQFRGPDVDDQYPLLSGRHHAVVS